MYFYCYITKPSIFSWFATQLCQSKILVFSVTKVLLGVTTISMVKTENIFVQIFLVQLAGAKFWVLSWWPRSLALVNQSLYNFSETRVQMRPFCSVKECFRLCIHRSRIMHGPWPRSWLPGWWTNLAVSACRAVLIASICACAGQVLGAIQSSLMVNK